MDIFAHLAAAPLTAPASPEAFKPWWLTQATGLEQAIDIAMRAGLAAPSVGFAFAAGYQCALRRLFPELGSSLVALCATEADGVHPRAIKTTLADGALRGEKRYVSLGSWAEQLLVIAREPTDVDGRPVLRSVLLDAKAPGLLLTDAPPAKFAPEIPHAALVLDGAVGRLLPGDGYATVLKPFRTLEDIFVSAAVYAHALRLLRLGEAPQVAIENALSLLAALHALSARDANAPGTHLALAGLLRAGKRFLGSLDPIVAVLGSDAHDNWRRDLALLSVAEEARTQRTKAAWKAAASF